MWGSSSIDSVHIVVRPEQDRQAFIETLKRMLRWLIQDARVNRVTFEIEYGVNNPLPDWFFMVLTSLVNFLNNRCDVQAEITNIDLNIDLGSDEDLDERLEEMAVDEDLPVVRALAPVREIPANWFDTADQFVGMPPPPILPNLWGSWFDPERKVPTEHRFPRSIQYYYEFRRNYPENHNANDFINWLINVQGFARGGAVPIAWPFHQDRLNIFNCFDAEVSELHINSRNSFAQAFLYGWHRVNPNTQLPINIADVYIVGHLNGQGGNGAKNQIIHWGCTAAPNSAQAILTVGRHMGRHFGWLDDQYRPTNFFVEYFTPN